jgi:hypothetical protein
MKYLFIAFASAFATFSQVQVYGQDAEQEQDSVSQNQIQDSVSQDQITDEELKKYAVAMDSINDMKASLLEEISDLVKEDGKMTNARYNELSKIANDPAKLAQAKATPEEIALLKKVAEKKNEGTVEINNTFQALAQEYVGAASYNKIKKALSTDAELKSKYEQMLAQLEKDGSE